ncbi:MAG: hypothetical protein ACJ8H8_08095 [Geminicoccaceae bacterium]
MAAADLLVERQRAMVNRLRSRGQDCGRAVALFDEMEQMARLICRSQMLVEVPMATRQDVPRRPDLAA